MKNHNLGTLPQYFFFLATLFPRILLANLHHFSTLLTISEIKDESFYLIILV